MKRITSIVVVLAILAMIFALPAVSARPVRDSVEVGYFQPILTPDTWGPAPRTGRLMVVTDGPVTNAMLEELAAYGTIHGVIERYNIVAVTPRGQVPASAIEGLPFVTFVEIDQPRYLTDLGTWDRDILDVTDVEETGSFGDPDEREVQQTGDGVHVAVIDTGLIKNWRNFLVEDRVATDLARAFMGGGAVAEDFVPVDEFHTSNPANMWERDTHSHGTAVASHIIGFKIGLSVVDGVAPGATIIPLKVFPNGEAFTLSSRIIAAIAYVTDLKDSGAIESVVINMSLGGGAPGILDRLAIQDAIKAGVIVVASAGNGGENGMGWPGAYPEVISVGATGWTKQFLPPLNRNFWRASDVGNDPDGTGVSEEEQSYVTFFSSRARPDLGTAFGIEPQELDVLAPGLWTVAPCIIQGVGRAGFCFWGGTSFSSPLTAGVAALILEKNSGLSQGDVESILKFNALGMDGIDSRFGVFEPFIFGGFYDPSWDTDCSGLACDPVGAGLVQADAALAAVP
ncbi:MAG: S8 family serine peptidase [Dehalococcoidia bacterium]